MFIKSPGALLLLVYSAVIQAQTECAKIEIEFERLNCYDRLDNEAGQENSATLPVNWNRENKPRKSITFSLLNERWELDKDLVQYAFRPYKPVYFLPVAYNSSVNTVPYTDSPRTTLTEPLNIDQTEAKLQLSFKTKLLNDTVGDNGDLWFGYTQTSHWQIYNGQESRPFRETNHEPEFMFVWATDYSLLGFQARMLGLSLNHQSNGQKDPSSRSWNRLILSIGLDRPNWVVQFRPWWRIPEKFVDDDNPDIEKTIGRGELLIVHRQKNSHQVAARIRHAFHSLEEVKGSLRLDWSYPCFDRLRCHAQFFHGYGESLIDFNYKTTSIGFGVALVEWF